eukprot:scaffold96658_cov12-Tisochrysis_lutea.AAC.1
MRVVCTFGTLCQQEALGHLGEKCRSYDQTIPTCAGRAKGAVREFEEPLIKICSLSTRVGD